MFGFLGVLVASCCVGRVTRLHRDANYHYDERNSKILELEANLREVGSFTIMGLLLVESVY